MPGRARTMGEGWETPTPRRRQRLGAGAAGRPQPRQPGRTRHQLFPRQFARICDRTRPRRGDGEWFEVLPLHQLLPDTWHRFVIDLDRLMTEARLDIFPDGGMARFRLYGTLTDDAEATLIEQWNAAKPTGNGGRAICRLVRVRPASEPRPAMGHLKQRRSISISPESFSGDEGGDDLFADAGLGGRTAERGDDHCVGDLGRVDVADEADESVRVPM